MRLYQVLSVDFPIGRAAHGFTTALAAVGAGAAGASNGSNGE